jgi:hypothetical protein
MRRLKIFWILLVFILFILPKQGFSETSLEKEWWYEKLKGLSIEEKLKNGFPDFDYIRALVEFKEKYIVKDENIKKQIFEKVRYKVLNKIKELSKKYPSEKTFKDPLTYKYGVDCYGMYLVKINKNYYLVAHGSEYIYDINNDQLLYWIGDKYYGNEDENLKFILKIINFLEKPAILCPTNFLKYCKRPDLEFYSNLEHKKGSFSLCYFSLLKDVPQSIDTKWIKKIYINTSGTEALKVNNRIFIYMEACKIHHCDTHFYQVLYEPAKNNCFGRLVIGIKERTLFKIIKSDKYWLGNPDENIKLLFEVLFTNPVLILFY